MSTSSSTTAAADRPQEPVVALVMPNLNGAKYLSAAIEAYRSQPYAHKRLVVVDSASTDASHAIIAGHCAQDPTITWLREPDLGISDAVNLGVRAAGDADVFGFIGSDDILSEDLLARVAHQAASYDWDALYFNADMHFVQTGGRWYGRPAHHDFSVPALVELGPPMGLQNIFFKRHVYASRILDPFVFYCMDYEFYLNTAGEGFVHRWVDETGTHVIFDGNLSSDPDLKMHRECCRVADQHRDDPARGKYTYR